VGPFFCREVDTKANKRGFGRYIGRGPVSQEGACESLKGLVALAIDVLFCILDVDYHSHLHCNHGKSSFHYPLALCIAYIYCLSGPNFGDFVDRIYPIELEIKDTTYTDRSASYLDLNIEIDSEGRLRTKLYVKRYDLNFPIVNFPFICSNIPAALAYGVYLSVDTIFQSLWFLSGFP